MRGRRETRPCAGCGKKLTKLVSQAPSDRWFCSRQCQTSHFPPAAKSHNPYAGQKETRPCGACGEPVTRYLRPTTIDKVWTCSSACMGRLQSITPRKPRTGDSVNCLTCGQEFYRQPAYVRQNRRYCSQPCWNVAQRAQQVMNTCIYCGTQFPVRPSEVSIKACSRNCHALSRILRPTGEFHNGKPVRQDAKGYVWIWEPDHPNKSYRGWQPKHRIVMESVLGRFLYWNEQVDHINQIRNDNRPGNLQVLSPSDHAKKTNADNLGALKVLREQLAELQAQIAALESSTD